MFINDLVLKLQKQHIYNHADDVVSGESDQDVCLCIKLKTYANVLFLV